MDVEGQAAEARLTLTFKGGLADRNRLPLHQVIDTLVEFQTLIREIGRRAQMQLGYPSPDGEFGLELLTNAQGLAFRKGSVKADIVATEDVANAKIAFARIIQGARDAETGKTLQSSVTEQAVVRHMARIAAYQLPAKNAVLIQMHGNGPRQAAKLTSVGYHNLQKVQNLNFRVDRHSLYGRLLALRDRAQSEEDEKHFWGELLADDRTLWRLKFPAHMLTQATQLFRRRVFIEGSATYFKTGSVRLNVTALALDGERDLLKAFKEGSGTSFFGDISREELLKELYA